MTSYVMVWKDQWNVCAYKFFLTLFAQYFIKNTAILKIVAQEYRCAQKKNVILQ